MQKPPPWGSEDPMVWCTRRARLHALWGSTAIAFLILIFGAGMYGLFTMALYEGDVEGASGLLLLLLSPFVLTAIGAVASGALALTAGRMRTLPEAPPKIAIARGVLWLSALLWVLLFVVFIGSFFVQRQGDFPFGIVTLLPFYMGLCVAVYTTGAALIAWSDSNRIESMMVIGLGWVALVMFLILPITVATWEWGEDAVDSVIFWIRFGNLFGAIVPWLIVLGLFYINGRNLRMVEDRFVQDAADAHEFREIPQQTGPGTCPECGGNQSIHPRTKEAFCPACGAGLTPEPEVPWPPQ
jgi:hypothetical protein